MHQSYKVDFKKSLVIRTETKIAQDALRLVSLLCPIFPLPSI